MPMFEFVLCSLCAYIPEGAFIGTAADVNFYAQYLASKSEDVGTQGGRTYNSKGAQAQSAVVVKVGPAVSVYDPELASALGLDGS